MPDRIGGVGAKRRRVLQRHLDQEDALAIRLHRARAARDLADVVLPALVGAKPAVVEMRARLAERRAEADARLPSLEAARAWNARRIATLRRKLRRGGGA